MAKYGIIAGESATPLVIDKMFKDNTEIEITYTPYTMENMIEDLSKTGGMNIKELKAILILDYAFDDGVDEEKIAEDFIAIQDLMHTNMLHDVRLYLFTKNVDLYEQLKRGVNGISGTYFEGTQIFITKGNYKANFLKEILQGERDFQGLYNEKALNRKSKEQRLRDEMEHEYESRRSLKEEYERFDTSDPITVMSKRDYLDSIQRKQEDEERRKEQLKKEREEMRRAKKLGKQPTPTQTVEQEETEIDIVDNSVTATATKTRPTQAQIPQQSKKLTGLQEMLKSVKEAKSNLTVGKLETDTGILSVIGADNSGGSGIVANLADVYAISKRKVLVIDLDISKRTQTLYFKQYDKGVKKNLGTSNSLIEVVQGYSIKDVVVPVSKMVDVLSISRDDDVQSSWTDAVGGNLENILIEAREEYDVVLLDIPFRLLDKYLYALTDVDRNIFVVENKYYMLENYIEHEIHPLFLENEEEMEKLILKSNIILNKFKKKQMDTQGNEVNKYYVREWLDTAGYPYDRVGVAGEIPIYQDWEEQYFTGVRQIWKDQLALGVYRQVFGKVVI